jgi:hypothetical protein
VLVASVSEAVRLKLHHRQLGRSMVASLAPTFDRTGVLSDVKVPRASRAAPMTLTARP